MPSVQAPSPKLEMKREVRLQSRRIQLALLNSNPINKPDTISSKGFVLCASTLIPNFYY